MNDAVYWNELSLTLRPMVGAAVVLAAFCAASMTLLGASSPLSGMSSASSMRIPFEVCYKPVAPQAVPPSASPVR